MHQFTLPNTRENEHVVPDPYDNDIYVQHAVLRPASLGLQVGSIMPSPLRNVDPHDSAEKTAADRLRKYRVHELKGELRILRGEFHRHSELSEDGGPDGTLIDQWRYMLDAAAMDWFGCCDHDNGEGREYSWWTTQKLVDRFYVPGTFVSIFSYERSVDYPEVTATFYLENGESDLYRGFFLTELTPLSRSLPIPACCTISWIALMELRLLTPVPPGWGPIGQPSIRYVSQL